jgi:uncharacterized protein (DUF302 family)
MSEDQSEAAVVGIVTKARSGSVDETVDKLVDLIADRGMTLFSVIDHSGEARRHGLELRDTKVVIFGSPIAGTPVMVASPLVALDLPLKVLVWESDGQTMLSYTDPEVLAARYHLTAELAERLAGIQGLVDAVVA